MPPKKQSHSHGGKRQGSGRKLNSGAFGEETKVVRIPESKVPAVKRWLKDLKQGHSDAVIESAVEPTPLLIPIYGHKVAAGFPSPADDYIEGQLDLNEHLIPHKEATFFLRVSGDSMINSGIHSGDLLVVDRSIEPKNNKIVIAALDGELTVKRLAIKRGKTWLMPENDDFSPIEVKDEQDMVIWGVVTSVIHQF
ncbi:MAG TPA: translesion error-prone DNA polymerase V autoproteolytic subunit [Ectothiorhodospiraceae bacterium]|nr:translesion error-prone DNA polymerase V autoproteolytic subunit [Ectothiorhodospiraceae bacterium]